MNKDDQAAHAALAELAFRQKDFASARRHLGSLSQESATVQYRIGVLYLAENQEKEAVSRFEKALSLDADFSPALNQVLALLVRDKKVAEAVARCREQIQRRPENAAYHVALGRLYAVNREPEAARKSFEKAMAINPNDMEALLSLARLEQSLGSLDKAIEKYEKILEQRPESLGIALLVASLRERKGEPEKAKAVYESILSKDPDSAVAANNLAFYYAEYEPTKENLEKAGDMVFPLIEKHRDVPSLLDTAAWVYYKKGEYEKARTLLLPVEEKGRQIPEMAYHLGMIHARLGEKAKAREFLNLALSSREDFTGRKDAEKALEELM